MSLSRRIFGVGAGGALILGSIVALPMTASAADKPMGAIDCRSSSIKQKEVHSRSSAKGNVTSQVYGAQSAATPWDHTSSVKAGYSSAYTSWNVHHIWIFKAKGGKVFGSGVKSARTQCE